MRHAERLVHASEGWLIALDFNFVIRALIDRGGPIETGEDLVEWVEHAACKGLGLAQTKP